MADKTTKPSRQRRHGEVTTCVALGILVAAILTIRGTDNDPRLLVGAAAVFIVLFLLQYGLELRHHRNQPRPGDRQP
ncbi:prepilin peptidase [Euzebya pacifica]|uniref:prepilin peptidase n=1 Tax=Euzebya pacifica TaxID=1608957 RepID=UPI000DF82AC5|nr:prepilin peptidase [Euzebya pacifica]